MKIDPKFNYTIDDLMNVGGVDIIGEMRRNIMDAVAAGHVVTIKSIEGEQDVYMVTGGILQFGPLRRATLSGSDDP